MVNEIFAQGRQANQLQDAQRTTYQKQVLKLANAVMLYQELQSSVQPVGTADFNSLLEEYKAAIAPGIAAARAKQSGGQGDDAALRKLAALAQEFETISKFARPLLIPPADPANKDAWQNIGASLLEAMRGGEIHPAATFYAQIATAFNRGDSAAFNQAVANYRAWLQPQFAREVAKGEAEYYFNQIKLFLHATIIYLAAFVLAGGALLTFGLAPVISESLRRSAQYLIVLAFIVHTAGLIFRMMLEGRPPVTNLYSSAIFIGWGACVLGIVLERVYRIGIGSAVAGLAGFVTLLIAHNLALGGDTMEMQIGRAHV